MRSISSIEMYIMESIKDNLRLPWPLVNPCSGGMSIGLTWSQIEERLITRRTKLHVCVLSVFVTGGVSSHAWCVGKQEGCIEGLSWEHVYDGAALALSDAASNFAINICANVLWKNG